MTPPLLAAHGLGVTIAGIRVCSGLDLAVMPGQCWAILGRNGAGKTTLLHTPGGDAEMGSDGVSKFIGSTRLTRFTRSA